MEKLMFNNPIWQSLFPEIEHEEHAWQSEHEMCCDVSCVHVCYQPDK